MRLFSFILLAFLGFRLWIITHLGLIDDEAYHWSWAKIPGLSYFDHPGMVAWVIWPFIKIFGDVEWALRLPGFLIYLMILFFIYQLARDLFSTAVARMAVVLTLLIPLWGFASLATMPDMPLGLFWLLSAWIFWQSVREDEQRWSTQKAWLWIGVCMGLGMNSKLTCCLLGLGMGLYLLLSPKERKQLFTPWPYLGALITFILMIPIFKWNADHEWATFDYQFLARHQEAHFVDWNRWLQFWVLQWLFMSPGVYLMMMAALGYGIWHLRDPRWRFVVCLPLPALLLFYYQPLMSAYKPHWSGPAYMILFLGALQLFEQGLFFLRSRSSWYATFAMAFLLPLQGIYYPLFQPVLPTLAKSLFDRELEPREDFSNDFYGWSELGNHLQDLQNQIQSTTGQKPLIAGQRYEIVAQLTWALRGSGQTAWQLCKDRDQYFYWQRNSWPELLGQNFLIVNTDKYPRNPLDVANFKSCQKSEWPFYRGQTLARIFYIWNCEEFSGLK